MHELTFEEGWYRNRGSQFWSCLVSGCLANIKPTQTRKGPENETKVAEDSSHLSEEEM